MIVDKMNEFCDQTSIAAAAGTALVGTVVDLGADPDPDIGTGNTMHLVLQVTTALASAGSATVRFKLASDATAAIATDGTATQHIETDAIPIADLVAGWSKTIPVPWERNERYLGILVTTGTATTTAGAINAFLTKDPSAWRAPRSPAQAL